MGQRRNPIPMCFCAKCNQFGLAGEGARGGVNIVVVEYEVEAFSACSVRQRPRGL